MVKKTVENFAVELVPLREVAGYLGSAPEVVLALADREGAKIVERWDGQLCIDGAAARKIRQRQNDEQNRELQLQGEHQVWMADRTARRRAAVHEAYQGALKESFEQQREIGRKINSGEIASEWATGGGAFPISAVADPQAQATARAAGTQAGREFDAKEPELGFYEWKESR